NSGARAPAVRILRWFRAAICPVYRGFRTELVFDPVQGRDCKERSIAPTRGGVQAALAASRTLHRVCPDLVSRELWIGRGPETACLSASEQVFFNSDTSMRNCSDPQ